MSADDTDEDDDDDDDDDADDDDDGDDYDVKMKMQKQFAVVLDVDIANVVVVVVIVVVVVVVVAVVVVAVVGCWLWLFLLSLLAGGGSCHRTGCSDFGAAMCQNSSFGTSQLGRNASCLSYIYIFFYCVLLEKTEVFAHSHAAVIGICDDPRLLCFRFLLASRLLSSFEGRVG